MLLEAVGVGGVGRFSGCCAGGSLTREGRVAVVEVWAGSKGAEGRWWSGLAGLVTTVVLYILMYMIYKRYPAL